MGLRATVHGPHELSQPRAVNLITSIRSRWTKEKQRNALLASKKNSACCACMGHSDRGPPRIAGSEGSVVTPLRRGMPFPNLQFIAEGVNFLHLKCPKTWGNASKHIRLLLICDESKWTSDKQLYAFCGSTKEICKLFFARRPTYSHRRGPKLLNVTFPTFDLVGYWVASCDGRMPFW